MITLSDKVKLPSGQVFEVSVEFQNSTDHWVQYKQISGLQVLVKDVWYDLQIAQRPVLAKMRRLYVGAKRSAKKVRKDTLIDRKAV